MVFPEHLKSDRGQWFQQTYAILPNGNWNAASQSIAILDNGEVWMYMVRLHNYISSYITTDFFSGIGEDWSVWLGKVSPEGCERVSGDELVYGLAVEDHSGPWGYRVPFESDTYLPDSAFQTTGWSSTLFTDGVSLYVFENQGVGGRERPCAIFKIDPVTYQFEKIIGAEFGGLVPVVDAPVGLDATLGVPGQFVHHDGWVYFPDLVDQSAFFSGAGPRRIVRRFSTTAPYPVETFLDYSAPAGWPGDSGAATWYSTTNPGTGLPNFFNDDVLLHEGSSEYQMGMVIWDGYFYFLSQAEGTNEYAAIKRAPLEGGDLETLFYGIGKRNMTTPPSTLRDNQNDSYEFPQGLSAAQGSEGMHWYTGVPDLEGWMSSYDWIAVTTKGDLIMPNWAGSVVATSYNQYATRQIRFKLPELVAYFQAHGPQRVNRDDPQWDTVVGATAFDETSASRQGSGARIREWTFRDGHTPLMTHQLMPGIAYNLNSLEWRDKVAYIQPVITEDIASTEFGNSTSNAMIVSVISEEGPGGDLQVNLYFDGVALKGYGVTPGMDAAFAPDLVTLT